MLGILLRSCNKHEMPMADMVVYGTGRNKYPYRGPFIDVSVHLGFKGEDSNVNSQITDDGCQVMTNAYTLENIKCTI